MSLIVFRRIDEKIYHKISNISLGVIDILSTFWGLTFRGLIFGWGLYRGFILGGHFVLVPACSRG